MAKLVRIEVKSIGVAQTRRNGNVVGIADLILIDDHTIHRRWLLVENVFVEPEYRRQGVGIELMSAIEAKAQEVGCQGIKMMSGMERKEGHALYRALGYVEGLSFSRWFQ